MKESERRGRSERWDKKRYGKGKQEKRRKEKRASEKKEREKERENLIYTHICIQGASRIGRHGFGDIFNGLTTKCF